MTIDHIQKVVVSSFRCLPDREVGPFGDFNLVFGRNGSGKTSLIEAIELALTGASARIHAREDVEQIVSRSGKAQTAVYDDAGVALGTFMDGKLEGGPQAQIRKLFGLEVTGKKASRLLPQLFGIYNLLYAETIVSFLHAEQKKELNNALMELTAGPEAVKTWKKLSTASKHARSVLQEANARRDQRNLELQRLQVIVNKLASRDDEHLVKYGTQLIGRIPPEFWDDERPPAVEQLPEFLAQVSRVSPRLSGALETLEDLTEAAALADVKSWADICGAKAAAEAAVEDARSSRDGLRERLGEIAETLAKSKIVWDSTCKNASALKKARKNSASLLKSLDALREWSGELRAHQQSRGLLEKRPRLKAASLNWSRIDSEIKMLPIAETVISKAADRARLKGQASALRKDLEQALSREREAQGRLNETEELILASKESWDAAQEAVRDLHGQLNRVLEVHTDSQCPACGHDWDSEKDLAMAISSRFESLSQLLGKPSPQLSKIFSERDELKALVGTASQECESKSTKLGIVEEKLLRVEEELSATVGQSKRLLEDAKREDRSIDVPFLDLESIGDRYRELPFEDLRARHRSAKVELETIESRLNSLWDGLRQQEFIENAEELDAHVSAAAAAFSELDLNLPADFAGDEMRELTAQVLEEESQTSAALAETEKDVEKRMTEVASLEEATKDIRAEVENADATLKERVEESSRASRVADLAEKLASLGLIPRRGALQLARVRTVITDAIADASYLLEEGPRYTKQLQEESQVHKELGRARAAAENEERQVIAAQRLVERFAGLAAPGRPEMQALAALASTVSDIFRRLHWPFDFKDVTFEEVNGALEVLVEPRFADCGLVPAHQRLSAGQRAALAISVFWALNSSREMVPKVMLMDEPVQNIDELNALNFLDSLRWLVERGGRQVFLSTASRRLAGLVKKKFAYLGSRFVEVELNRSGGVAEIEVRQDTPRAVRAALARASH